MAGQRPGQVLQFICLALLAEEPASGYDIRRKIVASELHPFVPHGQATVYAALKALEKDGKVISERRAGCGRPDQKLFRLLPSGATELAAGVLDPDDEGTIPILLRFQALLPEGTVREVVSHQLDRTRRSLATDPGHYPDAALADWRARASSSYQRWRTQTLSELLEILQRD